MSQERGSMLPMTAGLIFVAFATVALVVELSLLGAAYRDVATVADLAAESAAAVLSSSGAYAPVPTLDVAEAIEEARRVGSMWGSASTSIIVDADPFRVCVTVSDVYQPRTLAFIGVNEFALRVTGCAIPAAG